MFMKRLSVVLLLLAGTVTLHGQHGGGSEQMPNPWWVSVGVGANTWTGNESGTPAILLGAEAGRWIAPLWGVSLRLSSYGIHSPSLNTWGLSAMATATVDWTNLNGDEPFGFHFYTPFGAGAAFSFYDSRARGALALSTALGLRYSFGYRMVELFGEAGLTVTGAKLDGALENKKDIALMPTIMLGVRFALPSHMVPSYTLDHKLPSGGNGEPRGLIDDMLQTNEQLNLPATVVKFAFESSTLDNKARMQLNVFTSQIEAEGWFYIIAAADNTHASQSHNKKLCERRCKAVLEALRDDYGIDEYRLLMLPDGGLSEYLHQYGEQLVLIIQRTPETEKVVERWISNY